MYSTSASETLYAKNKNKQWLPDEVCKVWSQTDLVSAIQMLTSKC